MGRDAVAAMSRVLGLVDFTADVRVLAACVAGAVGIAIVCVAIWLCTRGRGSLDA